jgi:hypothetical protein
VDDRSQALQEIADLARRHGLSAAEIATAVGEAPADGRDARGRTVLVRVLGFLGGTFIFAGIGIFIALQWDAMNSASRIVATLGPGVAAFTLAMLSAREPRVTAAAVPLLLVAAVLEPVGMGVAFDELGQGGDWRWAALAIAGTLALQFSAAFGTLRWSTPLFLAIAFGALFWWTAFDLIDVDGNAVAVIMGGSMMLAAAGAARSAHREISPFWFFLGGAAFLGGLFDLVERTPLEILFLASAAGIVYLSVVLHSRTLLVVATLAILAYTGWFTGQHFADSIGWPLALILFGLAMIALSVAAFRIDRAYIRRG